MALPQLSLEETSRHLESQHPSTDVWFVRLGHRALHHIGWQLSGCHAYYL